jgi:hypothetical protein
MRNLLLTGLFALTLTSVAAKTPGVPEDDISDAVTKAKSYVQREKIDVQDFFIQKVEFKNQYDEYHPQFWEVTFLKVPYVKGGHMIVRVYNDGKIDHGFGE